MALNHVSFSQAFLAAIILILAVNAKVQAAVDSPFCAQSDPGQERALCNSLVNGAKTWDAALTNVIHASLDQVKPAKGLIDSLDKKLPATLRPVSKDSIKQTCQEAFQGVLDGFNEALANIKSGDKFKSINSELSAALDSLSDCTDGLNEFGVDSSEIKKVQDTVSKYASLSLAVSFTKKD